MLLPIMINFKLIAFIYIFFINLNTIANVEFNFIFEEAQITDNNIDPQHIKYIKDQFDESGKILGSYLNHNQSVDISVIFLNNSDLNAAALAISPLIDSDETINQGFYGTIVADKIQYGIDRNDENPDGYILFNIFHELTNICHLHQHPEDHEDCNDIKKTIIHELIHTLGFNGTLDSHPTDLLYQGEGIFSKYDYYIQNANGTPLWELKRVNSSALAEPGYFAGPNTKAAFFGRPLPLPQKPESNDSDYYHSCATDALSFIFIGNMMNNQDNISSEDQPLRLSAIEIAMLEDIGFNINIERAARTELLQQLLNYCPNFHNIKHKSDKLSIFSALICLLPEEKQTELSPYLKEQNNDLSDFLLNFNHPSDKN